MATFSEDDPKYLHCCGCHVKLLAKILAKLNASLVAFLLSRIIYNPQTFNYTIFFIAIATGVLVYAIYHEDRNCMFGYLIAAVSFGIMDVYFVSNHPLMQGPDSDHKQAVIVGLLVLLGGFLYQMRVFFLFAEYLREKQAERVLPMTVREGNNASAPLHAPVSPPPAYEFSKT